jgi:protocatechuate 3,4-dioxygenase beta subunit
MKLPAVLLCILVLGLTAPVSAGKTVSARGKVVDTGGKPVEGVKVYAVMWRYENWNGSAQIKSYVKAAVVTGEDGSWEFKSLPKHTGRGAYVFITSAPEKYLGWVQGMGDLAGDEWQWNGFPPEDGCYTLVAYGLDEFEGRVVDENGQGVAGALVEPTYIHCKDDELGILNKELCTVVKIDPVTTDSEGVFRFKGLPEGAGVGPTISADGFANERRYDSNQSTFVLTPGGNIKGRLVDTRGKGIAGIEVRTLDYRNGRFGRAQTGKDGCYFIKGLIPGKYQVSADMDDELIKSVDKIVVTQGQTTEAPDLKTEEGVFVKGRVLDSKTGKPVSDVVIQALAINGSTLLWNALSRPSDKQGSYKVKVLPGEVYVMNYSCLDPYYASISEEPRKIEVSKSGISGVDFKVKRCGALKGKVVDQSGKPLAGAVVSVTLSGGDGPKTIADEKGYFKFPIQPENCSGGG